MKTRDKALSLFIQFRAGVENFCRQRITLLCVNNAPELIHGKMKAYCAENSIAYEKMVPDSPSQNGIAECTNLTICNMVCVMLIDANLRDWFWPFAVLTAAHIKQ